MIVINQYRFPAAGGGGSLVTITYTTVSGTMVNSSGSWGTGPGQGLATLSLPASTDGTYQADHTGSGTDDTLIGWATVNNNADYTTYDYAAGIDSASGKYYAVSAGSIAFAEATGTSAAGDKFRLRRAGSSVMFEKTTDGTNWTTLYTFGTTTTARLYIKGQLLTSPASIVNPKGLGIT